MYASRKKITACLLSALLLAGLAAGCGNPNAGENASSPAASSNSTAATSVSMQDMDFSYSDRDLDGSWSTNGATLVTLDTSGITIDGEGASASGGILTIFDEGTYVLSGTLANGQIYVEAENADKIQIVLNGVSVTCQTLSALYIKQADKVFVTLAEGTENTFTDAAAYTPAEGEETVDGAVFSKADLTFNGSGSLTINGNYQHGIVSKDDLVITGGAYHITSVSDAMQGKDCVKICGGKFSLNAGGDGIKSNNAEDAARGFVSLDGGTFDITASNDGVQAETLLRVTEATMNLTTGGGSANASTDNKGNEQPGWGNWGGGRPNRSQNQAQAQAQIQTQEQSGAQTEETTSDSAKGLKAGGEVLIEAGSFTIDSSDDSLHSNGNVTINGGTFTIASGDDGVHADSATTVNGGDLTISKSYEGLEGGTVTITGGTVRVTASDDGINAAGGSDGSSVNGRPGQNQFSGNSDYFIRISGGYVVVDASGDGLDSNGNLYIDGGTVLVSGATNDGDGALDYDGAAEITGGIVVCAGTPGMAQTFGDTSSQHSLMYTFASSQSENQPVAVTDENGTVIASFTPPKAYQTVVVSAPGLHLNGTYAVSTGGTVSESDENGFSAGGILTGGTEAASITLTSVSTVVSDGPSSMGMGGGRGQMGTPPDGTMPGDQNGAMGTPPDGMPGGGQNGQKGTPPDGMPGNAPPDSTSSAAGQV